MVVVDGGFGQEFVVFEADAEFFGEPAGFQEELAMGKDGCVPETIDQQTHYTHIHKCRLVDSRYDVGVYGWWLGRGGQSGPSFPLDWHPALQKDHDHW